MKATVVNEEGFELIDHNDIVSIEHSSSTNNAQQKHMLSKKFSTDNGELDHWNDKGRKKWTILLFFGCLLVYATRTSVSICAVPMGKELGWDKQLSVSDFIMTCIKKSLTFNFCFYFTILSFLKN